MNITNAIPSIPPLMRVSSLYGDLTPAVQDVCLCMHKHLHKAVHEQLAQLDGSCAHVYVTVPFPPELAGFLACSGKTDQTSMRNAYTTATLKAITRIRHFGYSVEILGTELANCGNYLIPLYQLLIHGW